MTKEEIEAAGWEPSKTIKKAIEDQEWTPEKVKLFNEMKVVKKPLDHLPESYREEIVKELKSVVRKMKAQKVPDAAWESTGNAWNQGISACISIVQEKINNIKSQTKGK